MKPMAAIFALAALAACAGAPEGGGTQLAAAPNVEVTPGPGTSGMMTGPVAVVSTNASPSDEGVICRKLEPKTGSRVGARETCMTEAQWAEIEKSAQAYVKDVQDSGKWNFSSGQ